MCEFDLLGHPIYVDLPNQSVAHRLDNIVGYITNIFFENVLLAHSHQYLPPNITSLQNAGSEVTAVFVSSTLLTRSGVHTVEKRSKRGCSKEQKQQTQR